MASAEGWSTELVDAAAVARALAEADFDPPVEQLPVWQAVDEADPDRSTWGRFLIRRGAGVVGVATVTRLTSHGALFLWVRHGPVWFSRPDPVDEATVAHLISSELHTREPRAVFVRMDLWSETEGSRSPAGLITYDHTVVIDTSVDDPQVDDQERADQILARFKSRGRRDVRKSVRESGLECADETERASTDFTQYHALMAETAGRDGFVPWNAEFYRTMITGLGPDHCRVFAGRLEGELVCWSIVTISGRLAARYYAASSSTTMRRRVSDRLVLFECVDLASRGVARYDLMGIGSEVAPELMGLNEFKTKFSSEVTEVAPSRDIPLRPTAYAAMNAARGVVRRIRGRGRD